MTKAQCQCRTARLRPLSERPEVASTIVSRPMLAFSVARRELRILKGQFSVPHPLAKSKAKVMMRERVKANQLEAWRGDYDTSNLRDLIEQPMTIVFGKRLKDDQPELAPR